MHRANKAGDFWLPVLDNTFAYKEERATASIKTLFAAGNAKLQVTVGDASAERVDTLRLVADYLMYVKSGYWHWYFFLQFSERYLHPFVTPNDHVQYLQQFSGKHHSEPGEPETQIKIFLCSAWWYFRAAAGELEEAYPPRRTRR